MPKLSLEQTLPGYDIAIIGAGPAGCMVAKMLGKDYKVLLVDYRPLPRDKPCGGLLVEEAIAEIKSLNPPDNFIIAPKTLDVEYVDLDNGVKKLIPKGFMNIDRKRFDAWLLSLVPDSVDLVDKTKLADFTYTKDKKYHILILESNGEVKPVVVNFLIGADGALSIVREKIQHKRAPYYIAIQERLIGNNLGHAIFLYKDDITDFYSWLIPKGKNTLIGSALRPFKAREKFNAFKSLVKEEYKLYDKGLIDSALILRPASKSDIFLGKGNTLLVGEAAGLISPSSGEGISFALQSARFCAESVLEKTGDPLTSYDKKAKGLVKRIESKLDKSIRISSHKLRKGLFT